MYVRNAYTLLNTSISFGYQFDNDELFFKNLAGSNINNIPVRVSSSRFRDFPVVIRVGDGIIPVTFEDYELDNMLTTSQVNYYTHTYFKEIIGNKVVNTISVVVNNISGVDLTITEMGLFISTSGATMGLDSQNVMVLRDIIDEIILLANTSIRLTYKTETTFPS